MYKPKPLEPVEIEWIDAMYDSDFDGKAEHYKPTLATLKDIGYFIRGNRESTTVAGCAQENTETARWFVTVPTKLIRSIRCVMVVTPQEREHLLPLLEAFRQSQTAPPSSGS